MYVLAILPEVRLPGLHIQLPRGQKRTSTPSDGTVSASVKLKIPDETDASQNGSANTIFLLLLLIVLCTAGVWCLHAEGR